MTAIPEDPFFPDKADNGLITVFIEKIGAQGEGIATDSQGHTIYVPKTLVGEKIEGKPFLRRGSQRVCRADHVLESSVDRQNPFCPFFNRCGGCSLQHMKPSAYESFKKEQAERLLGKFITQDAISWGFKGTIGQRRRVSLSYRKEKQALKLGFFEQSSHHLISIDRCPLLTEALNKLISPLENFLDSILEVRDEGFIHMTDTATGIDLSWSPHRFKKNQIDSRLWSKWAQFGQENNLAQITRAGKELIVCFQDPKIDMAGTLVKFPSAAFLQPSQVSQEIMQSHMIQLLEKSGVIGSKKRLHFGDLFCGLGTFSLPLLRYGSLVSSDCAGQSLAHLKEHQSADWKIIERDLMANPFTESELTDFDAIVLDPPRAGAYEQVQIIAHHFEKPVVMISCDLATAARDAQVMQDGGYQLTACILFDQFPYTYHLETMCLFEKI